MTLTMEQIRNLIGNSFLLGLCVGGAIAFRFWYKLECLRDDVVTMVRREDEE